MDSSADFKMNNEISVKNMRREDSWERNRNEGWRIIEQGVKIQLSDLFSFLKEKFMYLLASLSFSEEHNSALRIMQIS